MTRQCQWQLVGRNTTAVVCYSDQGLATIGDVHGDPVCTRVHRILDQFLDCRCGALNHFTSGDTVYRRLVQLADLRAIFADIAVRNSHAPRLSI